MEKLTIIIGGFIGIMPAGGVTWDYIQYPLGFKKLGHDVYYIEDTRLYPIYQKPGSDYNDASSCVEHLKNAMENFGLDGHWAYRDEASGNCFGMSEIKIREICAKADVFVNISCSTFLRDEYLQIPVRILIDSDPMFTQIQYLSQQIFTPGQPGLKQLIDAHNYHFTFGENIGANDCKIPTSEINWRPTRQPICLDKWISKMNEVEKVPTFTTLMNWSAGKVLNYNGEEWGQKDIEFKKFFQIPGFIKNVAFSAVVTKTGGTDQQFFKDKIEKAGWQILDPLLCAADWKAYWQFIYKSYCEFSVAKNTYVKANTGWFSCRSACYLAMGKPVVTQDTGWSKFIPSGEGVFAFSDMKEAVKAIEDINADYNRHSVKAKEIAAEYFDSHKVLQKLLNGI